MYREERRDSENYWENIIDIMYAYFHDENLISNVTNVQSLHDGVLYWWDEDDIKDLEQRAKGDGDPEAKSEYARHLEENNHWPLSTSLRQIYVRITKAQMEDSSTLQSTSKHYWTKIQKH
eukprot:971133-Amphidinium_carterae.1